MALQVSLEGCSGCRVKEGAQVWEGAGAFWALGYRRWTPAQQPLITPSLAYVKGGLLASGLKQHLALRGWTCPMPTILPVVGCEVHPVPQQADQATRGDCGSCVPAASQPESKGGGPHLTSIYI